jgi:hypothetical protein
MNSDRHIWQVWADKLHRWGLCDWTASFLEAAGPLTVLGAQAIYMGQPLINNVVSNSHLEALAYMLEEPQQTRDFVSFLREGASH